MANKKVLELYHFFLSLIEKFRWGFLRSDVPRNEDFFTNKICGQCLDKRGTIPSEKRELKTTNKDKDKGERKIPDAYDSLLYILFWEISCADLKAIVAHCVITFLIHCFRTVK